MLEWRLDSSKPSAVPEGEAAPLQERGVVGLHLVETSLCFLCETTSHLSALDLGILTLQVSGSIVTVVVDG